MKEQVLKDAILDKKLNNKLHLGTVFFCCG